MENKLFEFLSKYISLTDEEREALLSLNLFHTFKKGEVLLQERQRTINNFFVLQGCIRVYYIINGEEKTTAFYTEMEGFTPQCVISNTPSEYYVSTVEDSILLISNLEMEKKINNKFPKFEKLCKDLSEELLIKLRLDFDEFKTSSPEQRYLNLLKRRPDLIQRVPQHQLASYLGIKPQSLSRLKARIMNKKN